MHNVLIAIDESENAMKAVEYAASAVREKIQVTLYHVLPKVPAKEIGKAEMMVGHHLVFQEDFESFRTWLDQKKAIMEEVMDNAKSILAKAGIDKKNVKTIIEEGKQGVARDILNEQKRGEYDTVVVGRRGLSGTKAFFSGSVSNKIVQHAKNCAVWVIE